MATNSNALPPFDIFRDDNGRPLWVDAAFDLQSAKMRMQQLVAGNPGAYFIYSQERRMVVAYSSEKPPF